MLALVTPSKASPSPGGCMGTEKIILQLQSMVVGITLLDLISLCLKVMPQNSSIWKCIINCKLQIMQAACSTATNNCCLVKRVERCCCRKTTGSTAAFWCDNFILNAFFCLEKCLIYKTFKTKCNQIYRLLFIHLNECKSELIRKQIKMFVFDLSSRQVQ